MDTSSPTNRCPGCGLIHHSGLWFRERRRRAVRYHPQLCQACQLAQRLPPARGKVDWEQGSAYPSGRAPAGGWAGWALGRLASTVMELPVFGWFRRRREAGAGPKAPPAAQLPAQVPGPKSRSLKPKPND